MDSRLLFKVKYCLPDCMLKRSQGSRDEHEILDQDEVSPFLLFALDIRNDILIVQ